MKQYRIFLLLYVLAVFFAGLGYLAIMPIFEGFDEYAHYSSMRQIAYTGTIPVLGKSTIDQTYIDYQGPLPYSHDLPPFDNGLTYAKFFKMPYTVEQYLQIYRGHPVPAPFQPSTEKNWQAQHPPLYYLLMAPVAKAASSYGLITQIFILRLITFLFALTGVALGFLAVEKSETPQQESQSMIGFFLYPLILPMFFPEFTRLGNDALCILWAGVLAFLLAAWKRDENNTKLSLAIGVTLGLGLLTKALFLPITAALLIFLSVRLWRDKGNAATRPQRVMNLLWMFYPALMIGGGWYLYTGSHFGVVGGGTDSALLTQQGGMIAGLKEHFSLYNWAIGIVAAFSSYIWAGTWSSVALPFRFRIPLFILAIWIMAAYVWRLRQKPVTDFVWLPFWLFAFFVAGLFYHLMIGLALDGRGQTPGWYLHILMPLIAPAIGVGACALLRNRITKFVAIGAVLYAVGFQIIALWSQFALFTGCATKTNGARYAFPGDDFCLDRIPMLIDRLYVLGWPVLAEIGFGGAVLCALLLLLVAWRSKELDA
ncbi:MAG: hypothetical protein WCD70_09200 [Alphaproteobacteria bacterium]